jgi:hypothetical protein
VHDKGLPVGRLRLRHCLRAPHKGARRWQQERRNAIADIPSAIPNNVTINKE